MSRYFHHIERVITSEMTELVLNDGAENAICTFNTSTPREVKIRVFAPLACKIKQPQSAATTTNIIISVANNATTSLPITSTTITNMIYVLFYNP